MSGAQSCGLLTACIQGDTAFVSSAVNTCTSLPTESLLTAIAWSRTEVVRILLDAGLSVTARATVVTPGGSGIPNAETQHISAIELSSMMKAGKVKQGARMHELVITAHQGASGQHLRSQQTSRRSPPRALGSQSLRKSQKRPRDDERVDEAEDTSSLLHFDTDQDEAEPEDAAHPAQPAGAPTVDSETPQPDRIASDELRERMVILERRFEELRRAFTAQGQLLHTLYSASAASAAVLAHEQQES